MTAVSSDPISPELALVCHELATRARAELPERPWQLFPGACGQSPDVGRAPVAGVGTSRARRFSRALLLAVPAVGAAVVFAVMKVVADSESTPPPAAVAEPAQSGIGPLGAVRSGGYVFADGVLQVSNNGRVVRSLSFTRGCARGGTTSSPAPLTGRLFRFAAHLQGEPVRVVVTGVFLEPNAATLLIDLQGGRCGSQTLRTTATLS